MMNIKKLYQSLELESVKKMIPAHNIQKDKGESDYPHWDVKPVIYSDRIPFPNRYDFKYRDHQQFAGAKNFQGAACTWPFFTIT